VHDLERLIAAPPTLFDRDTIGIEGRLRFATDANAQD
jgi:hypothetical protein